MAKIVITNGTIHSDEDFNLTSGANATTRSCFRICKERDSHTRLRSLSSFRIKTHDLLNTGNTEICGNLTVHGTCTTLNTTVTATTTTATDNFTIVSTEAGASAAPDFKLYRDSASPANNDSLGHIKFSGKDAAGNETEYASLKGCIQSVTSGGECGTMLGTVVINGSSCDIFRVDYAGLWAVNSKNFYISGNGQLRNYGQCLRLSTGGGAYDIQFEPNSVLKARLNPDGILFVCGKVDTPILKATSCTHYGACTSSKLTSSGDYMRHDTQYGVICIGPGNASYAHIQTDRSQFYFNKQLVVDSGHVLSYNEDLILSRAGNGTNRINIGTAVTTSCQPMNICGSGGAAVICAAHDLDAYATIGRAKIGCMCCIANDYAGFGHLDGNSAGDYALLQNASGHTILNSATSQPISFRINNSQCALFCTDGSFTACKGIRSTGSGWIYATQYFQGCKLHTRGYGENFHFCTGNMAGSAWMTAGRLYKGGSWRLNSQQGYAIPNTGINTCWVKFGAMCIPQHGYKMRMKVVASNGYGSSTTHTTQETTLLFQTANASEAYSGSSVCACVHSFIEGSTRFESDAPYCFIVHEVNSSFYEFFGKFNTYTGVGSYYTVDHGPDSGWIACNAFVDPSSCTGSCIVSVPNRGTIFCASASTTCICGTAIPQGDICMNNGSRGYKLGTDTAGSGSRAFLVLDSDGSDGIGAGSDYFFVANDGSDTRFYNEGPEHIRLCGSSCVAFCKPVVVGAKLSVGVTACPPETFGVCGSGMRIAHSAGNPVLYFGTSYGSVDVGLQRAGADSLDFKYYEGGWCNSFCLNRGCTKSCICHQSPILCGTSCVKTPMIQAIGGVSCFATASAAAADDWQCSALHIRERGLVSSAQSHCCYAPNINFHWAGRVSNSLWMDAVGQLNWGSYNANGCPEGNASQRFNTGILYGETCLISNVLAGGGSANSDYGTIQIVGVKNNWGGIHTCGYTFMACCNCSAAGIYNDSTNEWLIKGLCNGATLLYFNGSAKGVTLANGLRACGAASGCGYVDLCPNGSWVNMVTDRSKFYMNKGLSVNTGCISSYDEDLTLHRGHANSTAAERITITSGTTHICQLTKIHGNLCVTGQVCADGMQGDECTTVAVRTTISCFHPGCVVGRDNVYDIFVSANPNCDGGDYRDIHHIQAYVSTGYSGSAVTTYINSRQVMAVGGYVGGCGSTPYTQASVHLVNGSGAHAYEYPSTCTLCLGIQLCGGLAGGTNCCRRALECVIVKKIL